MNLWHSHDPDFEGTHTHEVNGSKVQHTHAGVGDTSAVTVFGARHKKPKSPATGSEVHDLEVDDSVLGQKARTR